ncbi:unnamed protein product [Linum trigynum]|uniref:Reverse transcriptase domain-containing protein n=1 Tax=Linum trigynum TaxID=586398 RepID=A0AAV2ETG6_9ROSI
MQQIREEEKKVQATKGVQKGLNNLESKALMLDRQRDMKQALYDQVPMIIVLYKRVLLNQELIQEIPPRPRVVLEEFEDVFPEEAPKGLPPICEIEHQIDFVPGATIPNKLAYRKTPEETKEFKMQIDELMEKHQKSIVILSLD